jgi:membrane protease YdiL (CAAX protease family)
LSELLRQAGPAVLAVAAVAYFDLRTRRAGLDPPGFREPARRLAGAAALVLVLWVGVFSALGRVGSAGEVDFASVPTWQLFLVHVLLASGVVAWWGAGFAGAAPGRSLAEQLGLAAQRPLREIGVGVVFGLGAWFVVLVGVMAIALAVAALGGADHLPRQPPAVIPWLAGQPFALRLGLALSAGVVEELFFRGLLQPRTGIAFSTVLFALAHVSYDQPFLLVGVTLLSVLYGLLVRWRQSVWAAMTAHALFDSVQLLVVIPIVLRELYGGAP